MGSNEQRIKSNFANNMQLPQPLAVRALGISCNEERIKLNLAPRTIPIETIVVQPKKEEYEYSKELVEEEKNKLKKSKVREYEKRQHILQKAFNSDDDTSFQ